MEYKLKKEYMRSDPINLQCYQPVQVTPLMHHSFPLNILMFTQPPIETNLLSILAEVYKFFSSVLGISVLYRAVQCMEMGRWLQESWSLFWYSSAVWPMMAVDYLQRRKRRCFLFGGMFGDIWDHWGDHCKYYMETSCVKATTLWWWPCLRLFTPKKLPV